MILQVKVKTGFFSGPHKVMDNSEAFYCSDFCANGSQPTSTVFYIVNVEQFLQC